MKWVAPQPGHLLDLKSNFSTQASQSPKWLHGLIMKETDSNLQALQMGPDGGVSLISAVSDKPLTDTNGNSSFSATTNCP